MSGMDATPRINYGGARRNDQAIGIETGITYGEVGRKSKIFVPTGGVSEKMDALRGEVSSLESQIDQLNSRLQGILLPETPERNDGPWDDEMPEASTLTYQLNDVSVRVKKMTFAVSNLIDRVDL